MLLKSRLRIRVLNCLRLAADLSLLGILLQSLGPTIMDKSLGTLLRFWGVFQFTQVQPLPSPHKQCWTRVSRIFSEIQLCIGWREGELQENVEKDAVLRGSREMTGKYVYCSTVPRTFVHDCCYLNQDCVSGS